MKKTLLIVLLLCFVHETYAQPVHYPCLSQLQQEQPFLQKFARQEIIRVWRGYYDYSKRYSESILDTIDILCIPTLHINIYQYPERDFTVMDSLFSSLLFSKKKRLPGCVYDEIMWYKDTLCIGNFGDIEILSISKFDSLAYIQPADQTESRIFFRAIQNLKYKLIFCIEWFNAWWLLLPDNSLLVYNRKDNHFYQPQEYLDKYAPAVVHDPSFGDYARVDQVSCCKWRKYWRINRANRHD
ncbi:hypothetical protein [Alistipes ihumii]|uniref:hypothetical protein n=1 Tax=Alistipes ihumii TaxID=1470347 RepID=UPI00399311B6